MATTPYTGQGVGISRSGALVAGGRGIDLASGACAILWTAAPGFPPPRFQVSGSINPCFYVIVLGYGVVGWGQGVCPDERQSKASTAEV